MTRGRADATAAIASSREGTGTLEGIDADEVDTTRADVAALDDELVVTNDDDVDAVTSTPRDGDAGTLCRYDGAPDCGGADWGA